MAKQQDEHSNGYSPEGARPADAAHGQPHPGTPASPDGLAGDDAAPAPGTSQHTGLRIFKYVLYGLGGLVAFVLLLLASVLLILQTNWGTAKATDLILGLVDPFDNATLTVGNVDGNWITHLSLRDVTVVRDDSIRMAHLDTLRLRYDLLPLLQQRIHVREAHLVHPTVTARQTADSTWDWLQILPRDTTAAPDTAASAFTFLVDRITVDDFDATARFYAPQRDSALHIEDVYARVSDLVIGPATAVDLDTLWGAFVPPGTLDTAHVSVGAELSQNRLALRGLRLHSPRSSVAGQGTLRLPADTAETVQDVDFRLTARPLAFRDIHPFVPTLDPNAELNLDVAVEGSGRLLQVQAEAAFEAGGTAQLTAAVTPSTEGPVRYAVEAAVRRLDPGRFTGGTPATSGQINADLRADLAGASLDQLDGTFGALAFDTRYGDYELDRTELDGTFADGQARVELTSGLRGASVALRGTTRPFDATPTYDLEGTLRDFNAGRFTADTTLASDLDATVRLTGEGLDFETADAQATLSLAPSTINDYRLEGGRLEARLADGAFHFATQLRFPQGELAADGQAQFADVPTYRVRQGRVENLDVAALLGDTTRSRLSGTFSLAGRGTDPNTLRLQADAAVTDSYYGPYALDAALDLRLEDGRLAARAEADLAEGGSFDLAATVRPFDEVIRYHITRGEFQNVDVGALAQMPDQQSNLNGSLTLEGRGTGPETMLLEARVQLAPSQLNAQRIEEASLALQLQRGELTFETNVQMPEGQVVLAGTATPFAESPLYVVRTGRFSGLNLGAFLGNPQLTTDLNGRLSLEGSGLEPETMAAEADLRLDRSRINDATLEAGRLEASIYNRIARIGSNLTFQEGTARLQAAARFLDERPRYEAEATIQDLNLARLAGNDTLEARLSLDAAVRGAGLAPETMTLTGRLDAAGTRFAGIVLTETAAAFQLRDGLIQVDTLLVRSNVATAAGGGQVALFDTLGVAGSDFRFVAQTNNLDPLRPLVGAEVLSVEDGELSVRATGRPGTLRFEVNAEVNSLVYDAIRLAGFELEGRGELGRDRSVELAMVRTTLDYLSVPSLLVQETRLEAEYNGDEIGFEGRLTVDGDRDARLAGRVDLRPENRRVLIEDLGLRFDQDRWELLQPASISYGDAYRVRNFLIYAGDQQIAVDGVVDPDGQQNLIVTVEAFRIGAIADLLDFQGLDGSLNGSLDLTGPATSPQLDGSLNFFIESYDEPVGTLDLDLTYADLRMGVDALLRHQDASTLAVEGTLPMDLRLSTPQGETTPLEGAVDVTVAADSFAIGWVRPFLDPETIDRLDGRLQGRLQIAGTLDAPVLDGTAALTGGVVGLPEFGVTYSDIAGDMTFSENQVRVDRLSMNSGGGSLSAEGRIELPELTLGEFDIGVNMSGFRAINNNEYQASVSGELALNGTTQSPILTGSLNLLSTDIYLDEMDSASEIAVVQLTERDLRTLEERFGYRIAAEDTTTFDFYEAMAMDLSVEMQRDTWLRQTANPEMAIQFSGRLDLDKAPSEEIQIFGTINVIPERSYIKQFGKRFNIATGDITFNGGPTEFRTDVTAEYVVRSRRNAGEPEATITLNVTGNLDDLNFDLGSEPQMETTDILSYIATGRPASESLQFGGGGGEGGGLLEGGAGIAAGQVAGLIEGIAGEELGLDVVEIETLGLEGTNITAGKYVSPELYLGISQPISFSGLNQTSTGNISGNTTEVTMEYQLYDWLLLSLTSRGSSALRFNLLWEYAY